MSREEQTIIACHQALHDNQYDPEGFTKGGAKQYIRTEMEAVKNEVVWGDLLAFFDHVRAMRH